MLNKCGYAQEIRWAPSGPQNVTKFPIASFKKIFTEVHDVLNCCVLVLFVLLSCVFLETQTVMTCTENLQKVARKDEMRKYEVRGAKGDCLFQ